MKKILQGLVSQLEFSLLKCFAYSMTSINLTYLTARGEIWQFSTLIPHIRQHQVVDEILSSISVDRG